MNFFSWLSSFTSFLFSGLTSLWNVISGNSLLYTCVAISFLGLAVDVLVKIKDNGKDS